MDINGILISNLKRLIKEKGFKTQTEFGEKAGKSKQQISDILTGKSKLGKTLIEEFAIVLEVDVLELYKGVESANGSFEVQLSKPLTDIMEEDTRTKVIGLVGNILNNGTPDQISALRSIAESINLEINEQKKAAPKMDSGSASEGRKIA